MSLEVAGGLLRGISYPPAGACQGALVLCDPFAEEKKSAENTLAALARALAEAGWWAWHWDYRGTGDSGGSFEEFRLADWREDLRAAVAHARAEGAERVGLVGLRLGATLAAEIAEEVGAWCVILWEPIVDGKRYVRELHQRTAIKGMLTEGAGLGADQGSAPRAAPPGEGMDLGGYLVTEAMERELGALRITDLAEPGRPTLIVECNARGETTGRVNAIVGTLSVDTATEALVLEPFWQRIGLVETGALIEITVEWLGGTHG